MKKYDKKLIHDIAAFLNTISEKYNIAVTISYFIKERINVDVYIHYYHKDALVDTLFKSIDRNYFIKAKEDVLDWLIKKNKYYGTKN